MSHLITLGQTWAGQTWAAPQYLFHFLAALRPFFHTGLPVK